MEAVIAQARWPVRRHEDWRDELCALSLAPWRAVGAHPNAIALILTRRGRSPAMLEAAEALLRALARSGRSGKDLLVAFRAVSSLIVGSAQAQLAGPLALQAGGSAQATMARFRELPPERFGELIEIAGAARAGRAEDEFVQGLDLLIRGLG